MSVYFIQAGDGGPVKIGQAQNPRQRLRELQCGNAEKFTLVAVREGDAVLEAELHSELSADRIRGEWFQLTDAVIEAMYEPLPILAGCPRAVDRFIRMMSE